MGKTANRIKRFGRRFALVPLWVHGARTHPYRKRGKFGSLRCDKLSSCSNWSWDVEVTRHTRLAVSGVKRSKYSFSSSFYTWISHHDVAGVAWAVWEEEQRPKSSRVAAWHDDPRCHREIEPATVHHSPNLFGLLRCQLNRKKKSE